MAVKTETALPIPTEEISQTIAVIFEMYQIPQDATISVGIVDVQEMADLNRAWRSMEGPTDVLAFEGDDLEEILELRQTLHEEIPIELGDVILAPDVIAAQAPEFGSTPAEEFRLMLVHGVLHLLGYDHLIDEDAEEMEAEELVILQRLAELRGEDPLCVRIGPTTRHLFDKPDMYEREAE
ncbi:rRNA maturation RNase YbeY [Collinsella sp. AGMB00827]|uniref:Endoribonuclease YbeY n=1 Tax=Collinsella ureilytica TaxID=2869515 RepID=A0ABS7MNJ2_9ACTN|nr:rRNA maturation RNase YbeY [Collinsella urealyticum]